MVLVILTEQFCISSKEKLGIYKQQFILEIYMVLMIVFLKLVFKTFFP